MGRKKQQMTPEPPPAVTTSLGDLLGGLGFSTSEPAPESPTPPEEEGTDHADLSGCRWLKLAIERKGRRGKSVTLLEGLSGEQAAWVARALRRELGCGVTDKEGVITIQGAQTERVRAWLLGQGARQVKGV
jgi:translation initiation factor 1 (eIF-1/SUI1)